MIKKCLIVILLIAAFTCALPAGIVFAESDRVLLVYDDKDKMAIISDLIKACGMQPVAVSNVEYSSSMAEQYQYVVLQDTAPLKDMLQTNKKFVCLGDGFNVIPGVQTETVKRKMHAKISVYNNTQSVIIEKELTHIKSYCGEAIGSIGFEGNEYPIGVITERIMFAPHFCKDDITVFAVAKMLNEYFGRKDEGFMYVLIDKVSPFDSVKMLESIAESFYSAGIPFVMSIMPVYYNTDYPSFKRYVNVLRYIQSKNGSLIMHEPIVTGNELVGEDIDVRMPKVFETFKQNGVHVFDESMHPYEVSLKMLAAIHPQNELFISLPIDTVIKYEVFKDENELAKAVNEINKKWIQIGDYRRNVTGDEYIFMQAEIDGNFAYRRKDEIQFEFLVDAGNRVLTVIVIISGAIIITLILFGYKLYREKFIKKRK